MVLSKNQAEYSRVIFNRSEIFDMFYLHDDDWTTTVVLTHDHSTGAYAVFLVEWDEDNYAKKISELFTSMKSNDAVVFYISMSNS